MRHVKSSFVSTVPSTSTADHSTSIYDLLGDTFETHEAKIKASLEPVRELRTTTISALEKLTVRSLEIDNQQATSEGEICQQIKKLHEVLESRKEELIDQLRRHMEMKRKNLAAQKDEL